MTLIPYVPSMVMRWSAAEADLNDRAPRLASALYRWCSQRVVLGLDITAAKPWLDAQLSSFASSDAFMRDLARSKHLLAAQALLHDEPDSQIAQRMLDRLQGQPDLSYDDQRVVSAALALAVVAGEGDAIQTWYERALAYPVVSEAASIQYELPFLVSIGDTPAVDALEMSAHVTARMIHDVTWAPPFYSSAPHVLALAVMAQKHRRPLAPLLWKRLEALDTIVFDDDQKPRLAFAAPQFDAAFIQPGIATLLITVRVGGGGDLNPGAHEIGELTGRLSETLQAAAKGGQHLPRAHQSDYRRAVAAAFNNDDSVVRVILSLGPEVTMSSDQQQFLTQRFDVAWRMARRQLPRLAGAGLLEIIERSSGPSGAGAQN